MFSPKVVIPQADLKPTEIIRQQINSASKTGRRSSKEYPSRAKSAHYSNKGKISTKKIPGSHTGADFFPEDLCTKEVRDSG